MSDPINAKVLVSSVAVKSILENVYYDNGVCPICRYCAAFQGDAHNSDCPVLALSASISGPQARQCRAGLKLLAAFERRVLELREKQRAGHDTEGDYASFELARADLLTAICR